MTDASWPPPTSSRLCPQGGDVYLLAQILHDWPDRDALEILRVCAAAMSPGARLIIVEQVLPPGGPRNVLPALMDVNMLIMLGGQERTGDEYEALLDAVGFHEHRRHDHERPVVRRRSNETLTAMTAAVGVWARSEASNDG